MGEEHKRFNIQELENYELLVDNSSIIWFIIDEIFFIVSLYIKSANREFLKFRIKQIKVIIILFFMIFIN